MKITQTKQLYSIFFATMWILVSEFIRNQVFIADMWTNHYREMGLHFPSEAVNGVVWGLWSLCLAVLIYVLMRKFTLKETAAIAWFAVFFMMWLVIGNLGVLPYKILPFAIPLSLLEVYVAALIIKRTK